MQTNRWKVYDIPHRAIRYALSILVQETGNTDFKDRNEVDEFFRLSLEVFRILEIHARDEEAVSLRHLDLKLPNASLKDKEAHIRLEKKLQELSVLAANIKTSAHLGEGKEIRMGEEFYEKLIDFQARYFLHMREEEMETQAKIHEYFTDEELQAHQKEIMSSLEKEDIRLWAKFILPNLPAERRKQFEGMLAAFA
ncbi:cation-binding protein [Leptospira langatensis]|uniref:Cation-binding protein n=1 Tax=Leptospira langatensis TaxID=2484983 RepID=A0A5F1ZWZ4_9LEPT|nr:cation-binding protein [Leptospira langatensis]TGK01191.1 cation-binding protein [Leptospira langatensis]TGL42358.1 cation-binding protein [Leptospira langatensis]